MRLKYIKMVVKKLISKIIRKEGKLYWIDSEGRIWEGDLNKGRSKKTMEKMKLKKEKKDNEKYF